MMGPPVIVSTEMQMFFGPFFKKRTASFLKKKALPRNRERAKTAYLDYFRMISTLRFCGSRTPAAVGTSGLLSP
jgi:hypothetical protein